MLHSTELDCNVKIIITITNKNHYENYKQNTKPIPNLMEHHNQSSFGRILFLELLYIVFYLLKII